MSFWGLLKMTNSYRLKYHLQCKHMFANPPFTLIGCKPFTSTSVDIIWVTINVSKLFSHISIVRKLKPEIEFRGLKALLVCNRNLRFIRIWRNPVNFKIKSAIKFLLNEGDDFENDEERRLFYVAITLARHYKEVNSCGYKSQNKSPMNKAETAIQLARKISSLNVINISKINVNIESL